MILVYVLQSAILLNSISLYKHASFEYLNLFSSFDIDLN